MTDVTAAAHDPSVCVSVTLMHPAKAVGRNKMPFGRDTDVVPSITVIDSGSGLPMGREDLGLEPSVCNDAAYCQITMAFVVLISVCIVCVVCLSGK